MSTNVSRPEIPQKGGRRNGSILAALLTGIALVGIGVWSLLDGAPKPSRFIHVIDGVVCFIFAFVLFVWVWSPPGLTTRGASPRKQPDLLGIFFSNRNWGVGFETVTMVVGVVTAVIAILTLTKDY